MAVAWPKSDDTKDRERPSLDALRLTVATVPRTERNGSEIPLWFVSSSAQVGGSGERVTHLHVKYPHRTALGPTAAHSVMREQLVFLQVRAQANGDKKWLDTFAASVRSIGGMCTTNLQLLVIYIPFLTVCL